VFGRVDAFIANAGIYPRKAVAEMTPENWRQVMAINLEGAFFGAQAAAELMKPAGYGKIVLVSSIQVELGVPLQSHYVAAKAGIIGMARSLSRALGPDGIRVNVIMPGAVHTEMEEKMFDPAMVAKWVAEHQAINVRIEPEDIEPSFAFLCSSESDAITGQVLCVDLGVVGY
jgi:3-oxoacyl-[acyl-carrier protein] reductase